MIIDIEEDGTQILLTEFEINSDDNIRLFSSSNLWCNFCFVKYDNISKREKHFLSKKHLKKIQNKREIFQNNCIEYCAYCLMIPSGKKQLEYHLKSLNHIKQKKKYKLFLKDNKNSNIIINLDNKFESCN